MILEVTKTENFTREMSFREVKEETSELYSYNCISSRFTLSLLWFHFLVAGMKNDFQMNRTLRETVNQSLRLPEGL